MTNKELTKELASCKDDSRLKIIEKELNRRREFEEARIKNSKGLA